MQSKKTETTENTLVEEPLYLIDTASKLNVPLKKIQFDIDVYGSRLA